MAVKEDDNGEAEDFDSATDEGSDLIRVLQVAGDEIRPTLTMRAFSNSERQLGRIPNCQQVSSVKDLRRTVDPEEGQISQSVISWTGPFLQRW